MAIDFIKVDSSSTTATHAEHLIRFKSLLLEARDKGKFIIGVMGHLNAAGDYSEIEALFGLPVGAGNTVYDLVNGALGSMEGTFQTPDAQTLIDRVGPGRNI